MSDRWYRLGRLLFAVGVLATALVIVAAVTAITGDPRASVRSTGPGGRAPGTTAATSAGLAVAADGFVAGANAAIVAVTRFDYRSLDDALTTGLGVTTGTYRQAYRTALSGAAAQRLRAGRIVQSFEPNATGIGAVSSDLRTAHVLIFGVQTTTLGTATPERAAVTLTATVVHRGDRYLISQLGIGANPGLPSSAPDLARAAEAARQNTLAVLGVKGATGRVTALAVQSAAADQVVFLVAGTAIRTVGGRTRIVTDARLRVTVQRGGADSSGSDSGSDSSGSGWQVIASQSAIQ